MNRLFAAFHHRALEKPPPHACRAARFLVSPAVEPGSTWIWKSDGTRMGKHRKRCGKPENRLENRSFRLKNHLQLVDVSHLFTVSATYFVIHCGK